MKTCIQSAILALLLGMAGPLTAQAILQYGFDATSGDVAVPVNDDSGVLHHGTHLLFGGAAPTYSADIPTAGTAAGQARNVTGVGSVDFTSTTACISTANSGGVGSGQGIVTAAEIVAAGGLTMEVWVKNPGAAPGIDSCALNLGGTYALGIRDGSLMFFGWVASGNVGSLRTNAFNSGQWNHLAAVLSGPNANASSYTAVSFYLNGNLVAATPITFNGLLSRAASIGNHQYGEWANFNGLIYEPRVSLGALTPSQFTVVEPAGSLTAPELVEGSTNGEVLPLAVRVRNSAASAYHVTGISFTGAAAAAFSDDGNVFPLEIPANGTADVFVGFTPGAGSLAVATLTLATDDPNAPTLDVDFSIQVRDPEISVATSHDFGLFLFPPGPTAREITVRNLGLAHDLVLSNPQLTGAGAVAYSVSLPGPISDSEVLTVTFNPTMVGEHPASLSLTTNDPYHPTVNISLSGRLAGGGTRVMQWGFDATTGSVTPPVNDDSGNGKDGTHVLFGVAPPYSPDIPSASLRQHTTGVGAVNFTGTNAAISTADSVGVNSGQGIITATDVYNAGGYTIEVWVKNPSHVTTDAPIGLALAHAGMHGLGENNGRIGWFNNGPSMAWSTDQFSPGEWNHLAVVMRTNDPTAKSFTSVSSYLNGILIHSAPYTFPWFLDRAFSVGNHQYNNWGDYEGLVYEPRVSLGALGVNEFTFVPGLRTRASVIGESGGFAAALPVTITNSSAKAYQVTGVAYSGADAAAFSGTPTLPLVIPAGGSSEMLVGFTPTHGGGTYTATLTLTTNDPINPTMVVTLTVVVAGADANLIRVTATNLVSPTRMRIDFEGKANTAYQVKSSADLQQQIFTGVVTVAVDGLTTNDTGGGRGVGFVEFDITVPGRMFYQIQQP